MAKNQINFSKMSKDAAGQLKTFKESAIALAKEDLRFKEEMKPLKEKLENILSKRNYDLEAGLPLDEVVAKYSRVEVDKDIEKAKSAHDATVEKLNKAIQGTYAFIPEDMYSAYLKKVNEHKRGQFFEALKKFLSNLGIEGCSQAQISKLSNDMSDSFGAKYASSKTILEKGTMHVSMSKAQFNKLFMAVFCDMYVK